MKNILNHSESYTKNNHIYSSKSRIPMKTITVKRCSLGADTAHYINNILENVKNTEI